MQGDFNFLFAEAKRLFFFFFLFLFFIYKKTTATFRVEGDKTLNVVSCVCLRESTENQIIHLPDAAVIALKTHQRLFSYFLKKPAF